MAKILVIGSINMDLVVRVSKAPMPGETVLGDNFETYPGGKGANQAVAAARMGGLVTMVGRVGNDDFGDRLIQSLVDNQVKTTHVVKITDAATGIAMIAVAESGENMIVVASGANKMLTVDDVKCTFSLMRESDILLLQLESPIDAVTAAVELAQTCTLPVILNPAPAQSLSPDLLKRVDYLTPNESELLQLTHETEIDRGISKVLDWGVKNLVVTLGQRGVRVVSEGIDQHIPAFEIEAVDTTAAGDAFNGALAVALAEGKPLIEAVLYGMAAGALAATRHGAQPSLPAREEVESLIKAYK